MENKRLNLIIKYIILMIFCIVALTGCSMMVGKDEVKTIKDKTTEEIKYLEEEILTITNKYIKGEYTENDEIKWEDVNKDAQKINNSLDTVMLDLSEIDISNEEIINFRNEVNNLMIAIGSKDKYNFMQKISYLYSLLPNYLEKYSDNKNKINIMKLKSLALSGLVYANALEWEQAKNTMNIAETKYKEMMDDVDYIKEYSYNLNKVYILLEELKNAIDIEEVELARQKYINFIEKV